MLKIYIANLGKYNEGELVGKWVELPCEDLLTALEQFEDNSYFYKDMTLEDVAEELVSEGCFGYIPDSIAIYIDYAAIARDLECDSYFETKQGVIYLC